MLPAELSARFQSLPLLPTRKLDMSGADFRVYGCVHSRTLWVPPTNSPVRPGVSPDASTLTGFFSQRFWSFISPHWNPGLHGLSHSPVVPPGSSTCKCGTTCSASQHLIWSSSLHLAMSLLHPSCLSSPLVLVWMTVSSLTPGLSDFHTVWFFFQFWLFFVFKFVVVLFGCARKQRLSTYTSILAESSI